MVKLKGFQKLTLTDQALKNGLVHCKLVTPLTASGLFTGCIRTCFSREELVAKEALPRFDKSAMDGYALKSADTIGASQSKPIALQLTENQELDDKQAKPIWTGNPIPKGADAVVMLEYTERQDGKLKVWSQLPVNANVSKMGEDIKKGNLVAKAGTRLTPYHIGLAAALGYSQLKVAQKPKIGILATGNELAEVGTALSGNLIYDSNKIMISAVCSELGAETTDLGIAKDNVDEISEKIKEALETQDAIITTGGTSVGGLDLVPDAVNKLGETRRNCSWCSVASSNAYGRCSVGTTNLF